MERGLLDEKTLNLIKPRKENSSKGDFGTLLTLCGSKNMTGAAYFAVMGALRSGVGLLRFCGDDETLDKAQQILFEPTFLTLDGIKSTSCTAFLCGCGIGRTYDGYLEQILTDCNVPCVLDADCINFLSQHIDVLGKMKCQKILTPHPGEMARLCKTSIDEIQASREEITMNFARENNCILVLKGKNTVVADPNGDVFINQSGSSALAKGGSGDVLAGVIASLLAQGYCGIDAAKLGVYSHGLAADNLAKSYGKSGVIPSDLPKEIGRILG
jgi:NAD(P)H-hydrate epimerase